MRDAMALKSKLEKNRKAFIKNYFSESEAKSRYHPEFNKELLALFDRTQYHVHEFQETNFSRTVNQQFWEPLGKPKVDEEFPLSSVWMLRQIKELTPTSISGVKQNSGLGKKELLERWINTSISKSLFVKNCVIMIT